MFTVNSLPIEMTCYTPFPTNNSRPDTASVLYPGFVPWHQPPETSVISRLRKQFHSRRDARRDHSVTITCGHLSFILRPCRMPSKKESDVHPGPYLGEVGACPHVEACPHTLLFTAARNIWSWNCVTRWTLTQTSTFWFCHLPVLS